MSSDSKKGTLADVSKSRMANLVPPPPMNKPVSKDPAPAVEESTEVEPSQEPAAATALAAPAPTSAKPVRQKKSGPLAVSDVVEPQPPKGESYPRQVRISEKHHYMLREIAFKQSTNISHVLYNLLDLLEEANQREQVKGN